MSVPSSPPRHISQPNTPTPAWLLESEKRYRDAMVGKRFYGEEDESVVQVVRIYPVPVGTVGKVRKRRKVGVNGVSVRVLGDEGEHVSGEVGENEDPSSITKRSTHYNGNGVVVEKEEGYHSEEDVEKVEGRDMVVEEDGTEQASLRARIKGVDIRGGVVSGEGNGVKADIGGSTTAPVVRRRGDKSHEQKMNAQTKTKTQKSSTTSHESFLSPEDLTRRNRKRKSTPPQD
ncbi:hypothetical protein DFH27DRAFT_563623 [Peziza echinospora]|nr:hypothetical protein DFH27DRAFT_563623 [Peziza echinospora]